MRKKRVAVFNPGRHCQARAWEHLVWGDLSKNVLGQIPKAIEVALDEDADLICWGTGASSRHGNVEVHVMYHRFETGSEELADRLMIPKDELLAWCGRLSKLDRTSQNTSEEMRAALELCLEEKIQRIFIVSAGGHVMRCHQVVMALREANFERFGHLEIFAVGADTTYAGSTIGDVTIVEPPHRGDMPGWQTHRYQRAEFPLMRNPDTFEEFLRRRGKLIEEFGGTAPSQPKIYDAVVNAK